MTQITGLLCEYRTNPLGLDVTQPRFGWRLQTDRAGARQTAYRILAASSESLLGVGQADLWDSGKVETDQSLHIEYAGKALNSRQRIYWQVRVWDESGQASDSDPAWFEIGLLQRADWQAQWIGADLVGGPRSTIPAPYLRKPFSLAGRVQAARLYITALGLVECSINGQVVGDDVFIPGWTDYNKRIQYVIYDVTPMLQAGENVIGAVLGDGWAVGHVGPNDRQFYVDRPRLFAQLEIVLADGSTHTVVSDASWKHQYGPLLDNDMIMGEAYDARLEMPGWDLPHFDDSAWRPVNVFEDTGALLVATNGPTVKRMETLIPIAEPTVRGPLFSRRYIFDLGQNMVGRVRLKASAPAGTTIKLRFAEVLDSDGALYTANLRTARVTDYYTFKGDGEAVWEPKFTFHGFRYVELSGLEGEITRDTITGVVLYSEMATTGHFECSDPAINQLQHNILWGQKGNFVDVPTDCPQRDERLGWTGDIQVFARTAASNMDTAAFMTKWAQDVADAQNDEGHIPSVVPNVLHLSDGGPAWADAAIICPWTVYLCYGDKRILEQNYAVMSRFMDFMLATSPGYIRCAPDYEGWLGVGDWLSINADTPRDLIGTAFLAYDANLMSMTADVLGKPEDAARYRQLFTDVKAAFGNRYLAGSSETPDAAAEIVRYGDIAYHDHLSRGKLKAVDYGPISSEVFNTNLFTPTQTAYSLALHFDLLPDELRPLANNELVADIERRGMHLSTGFVGSPYLPHVLSNHGCLDTAYALLHQETWPSWLYAVMQGATTIWERWDGWTEENGFQDPEMNSFNHYAYGAIGAWFFNTIAGIEIDPAQPGYKHILIQPRPGGKLTHASGRINSLYGEIRSQWAREDSKLTLSVTIPPNTSATIYLPSDPDQPITLNGCSVHGLVHELGAGSYQFVIDC